jgi:type III secretion system FlhB-like substrate exporter
MLELGTSIPPEVYNIVAKPLMRKLIGFVGKI